MSMSTFERELKGTTKEEKQFLRAISKLMENCPYSLRSVLIIDARDEDRSDIVGVITGCCAQCSNELIIDAAVAIAEGKLFTLDETVLQ
jgi:hypothetical protein